MAILRNREVIYLGPATAADPSPTVRVQYIGNDNSYEFVKLSEVRFTEDEKDDLVKAESDKILGYNTVSDKELADIRASQDPKKNEEFAKKNEKK